MAIPVDLWFWPLDAPAAQIAALARHLSPGETDRASRFIRPGDGDRFRVGRGRMREILAGYAGGNPAALDFALTGRRKPTLANGPAFNLSHAGGWAALAVAPDHPGLDLGIDIEAVRPVEQALAERVFSARECGELAALPAGDWLAGFFNAWTRKEAMIKATGIGFGIEVREIEVTLAPGAPAAIRTCPAGLPPVTSWDLQALDTGTGLHGALAAVTGGRTLGPLTVRQGKLPLPAA